MVQLETGEASEINKMCPTSRKYGIGDRVRALESGSNVPTGTEAQIPIAGTDGVMASKTVSGEATITKDGAVALTPAANRILKSMVKIKTIVVTVIGGASTGTITDATAINGAILGVYPATNTLSAIKSAALTAVSGKIDIVLNTAQTAGQDATIAVVVLEAT